MTPTTRRSRAFGMSLLLLSVIVVLARRTRLRRLFGPASEPGPAATTPVPISEPVSR